MRICALALAGLLAISVIVLGVLKISQPKESLPVVELKENESIHIAGSRITSEEGSLFLVIKASSSDEKKGNPESAKTSSDQSREKEPDEENSGFPTALLIGKGNQELKSSEANIKMTYSVGVLKAKLLYYFDARSSFEPIYVKVGTGKKVRANLMSHSDFLEEWNR